jgi:hypothetical protein
MLAGESTSSVTDHRPGEAVPFHDVGQPPILIGWLDGLVIVLL